MPDHVDSVKGLVRLYEKWSADAALKGEDRQVKMYEERIIWFNTMIDEIEHLRRITKPIPGSYGDLSDLPPELVKELTGIKVDDLEQQLFTIIKSGKEVDLDAILIELYRRFEVIQTRKFLQNKLWRMVQKEVIFSVSGRKGVYTATKPAGADGGGWTSSPNTPKIGGGGFGDDLDDDIPF